jgi:hypothetical protein
MDIFLTPEGDGSVLMSKCGSIPVSVEALGDVDVGELV